MIKEKCLFIFLSLYFKIT